MDATEVVFEAGNFKYTTLELVRVHDCQNGGMGVDREPLRNSIESVP